MRLPKLTAGRLPVIGGLVAALALVLTSGSGPVNDDPDYPHGDFRETCALCHVSDSWSPAVIDEAFDHDAFGFPLENAHRDTPCLLCHLDLEFSETTGSTCADCHQDPHLGELGVDCSRCHDTRSFLDPIDDRRMHRTTRFPLVGVHATVDCDDCHGPVASGFDRYSTTPTDCWACHADDFRATVNPDHAGGGFPTDCSACHTEFGWGGADFDHSITRFPLTGAHRAVDCASCHVGFVFAGTPRDCWSCHEPDWNDTDDPDHAAAQFPTDCSLCHDTSNWDATFDHGATAFPLTGAHVPIDCNACHGDGVYAGLDPRCIACHEEDYLGTDDPDHVAAGFSNDCTECHNTQDWDDANFNHDTTAFPLTGLHVPLDCNACHVGDTYAGLASTCYACHQSEYESATTPDHLASGFPTDCAACHDTQGWPGAVFDHGATAFPLTGSHVPLDCNACHGGGVYSGLDTNCVSCHQNDYLGTNDPDHLAAGFSNDCTQCHDTQAWDGATFDHAGTAFPLTGAHVPLGCNDCHGGGVYDGLDPACAACHQSDYDDTTDPDHAGAHFPVDCLSCHDTNSWFGATFNHDDAYFPIDTGRHSEEWNACSDCHSNPSDYRDFSCFGCHPHSDRNKTDEDHSEVGNDYEYTSAACYSCHPNGD